MCVHSEPALEVAAEKAADYTRFLPSTTGRYFYWMHGRMLDALDANLEWFGRDGAQALEYWLDVSRFSGWQRDQTVEIPWNEAVFRDDLGTYARRGIRHVTTFAAWLDGDYARRWGVAPVHAYGTGLSRWKWIGGEATEQP